jgi:magnesium transporter
VPGLLVPSPSGLPTAVRIIAYDDNEFCDRKIVSLDDLVSLRERLAVVWVDIVGFADPELITALGRQFNFHPLALEDAVNTHQRPKAEDYGDHVFIVARMLDSARPVETEQIAMFLGEGFVITLQERPGDCFDAVRERLKNGRGRIRSLGADYLCYALIDTLIDFYFPALEHMGERLEELEDAVVEFARPEHIEALHDIRRDLLMLRRAVWPHREMLNDLLRDEHAVIRPETRAFVRDCYDHTIQLMDVVETYREIASGLIDIYMSSVSVRLNEVMKVLTVMATVFMPLSFIASVYGMNFDRTVSPWNMPELGWYFGYPFALFLMAASAAGLVWFMWRKGWVGERTPRPDPAAKRNSPPSRTFK